MMPKFEKLLQRLSKSDPTLTELNLGCSVTLHGGLYYDRLHDAISNEEILQILLAIRPDTYIKKLLFPLHRSTNNEIANVLANIHIPMLSLSCNQLTEEGGVAIASNPYLRELDISMTGVGDKTAMACAANTSLLSLQITCNHLTDAGAKALASNNTLKILNLEYNHAITAEGAISFANNATLEWLNINGRNIEDEGAKAFAKNTSLRCLYLGHNQITNSGTEALAKNTVLQQLYLDNNQIGDEGAKCLAKNSSITELSLSDNQIGVEGAKALAANSILLTLNLSRNRITTEGALAFAQNLTLTSLSVQDETINRRQSTRKINTMLTKNKLKLAERSNFFIMSLSKWSAGSNYTEARANLPVEDRVDVPVELRAHILSYLDANTFLMLFGLKHFAHIGKTQQQAYECMKFILNNPIGIAARLTPDYGNQPIIREKKPELGEHPNYRKHFSFYKPASITALNENDEPKVKKQRLGY